MRSFVYDGLGRMTGTTNPESGNINYAYNGDGTLKSKTHGGVITTLAHDALKRVVSKSYTGGLATDAVVYCYDGDVSGACADAASGALSIGRRIRPLSTISARPLKRRP